MVKATQPATRAFVQTMNAPTQAPSLPSAHTGETPSAPPIAPPVEPLGVASVPRWKRAHDSRMRKRVARILVLKMAGHRTAEIARRLDTTPETIRHYLYIAGKNGWLSPDGLELVDPTEQLLYEAGHKIVRNISHALDGRDLKPQQYDITVEAAKGTGLFKQHSATKVEGQVTMPALEIKFVLPNTGAPFVPTGDSAYGGAPAYIEGDVIEPTKLPEGARKDDESALP